MIGIDRIAPSLQPGEDDDQHTPPRGQRDPHPGRRVRDPKTTQDRRRREQDQQIPVDLWTCSKRIRRGVMS